MSSKECEEQLKELIYDWETEGLLTKIYATDIEAIKHLMLENQMQQDTIKTQKIAITNLNERIDKAIDYVENGDLLYLASKCSVIYRNNVEVVAVCDRLNELLEILKGKNNE